MEAQIDRQLDAKKQRVATGSGSGKKNLPFDNELLRVAVALYCKDANYAEARCGPISEWDVSKVTDMRCLFFLQSKFNGDLSNWDVSSVTDMECMFKYAHSFSSDISKWNVSKVTDMDYMFENATSFNCDLSMWDFSSVTLSLTMFEGADEFDYRLSTKTMAKMHDMGFHRPGWCLWTMARRLAKTRCIAYFWFELAARPRRNGEAPPGAVSAFVADF